MKNKIAQTALIEKARTTKPLVHHITNYVSVNDCANITLAIGGSPIMADAIEEIADIVGISSSVVLNIGTLNTTTLKSMIAAGKKANELDIPVIFDPVGAGASTFRNKAVEDILKEIKPAIIKGNISEICYIAGFKPHTRGVDASPNNLEYTEIKSMIEDLARKFNCVIAVTGTIDFVSNGNKTISIKNGHSMLSQLTGTGCMCSSLIGVLSSMNKTKVFESTVTAMLSMGIAGEIAFENEGKNGSGSFHTALINAIGLMNTDMIVRRMVLDEI